MARTIQQALADAKVAQGHLVDARVRLLPLAEEDWDALGDRCISDAVDVRTEGARYGDSIKLAAICYGNADYMRARRANNWNEPHRHEWSVDEQNTRRCIGCGEAA